MLSKLLDEIEERLRQIIREEVRAALSGINETDLKIDSSTQALKEKPKIKRDFPDILIADDIAEMLGISVQRVYELTRQRKSNGLPVIVLGERQYRYSREAILEWIERDYK